MRRELQYIPRAFFRDFIYDLENLSINKKNSERRETTLVDL
jgi:hypothetical protein